jgi:hypothetical protein
MPVLSSTFFLTFLLAVGLFFFIRASVKDRTQSVQFLLESSNPSTLEQLTSHFQQRSYQIAAVFPETNETLFTGVVRPSVILAVFLTLLAAVGLLCLSVVLFFAWPSLVGWAFLPVGLAPVAGWFYWRKAKRPEQVIVKVVSPDVATVIAHRDELIQLQRAIALTPMSDNGHS